MRTIVIGDVHGCLEELDELLRTVQYAPSDELVFLGDYMDRGPDPVGVVRRVRELGARAIKGNHEDSHIRWRRHEDVRRATGKKNPMRPFTEERRLQNEALSDDDIAWMKALPLTLPLSGGFVAVHGGFTPRSPLDSQHAGDIIRMRYVDKDSYEPLPLDDDFNQPPNSVFWSQAWRGPEHVVYGHAVMGPEPFHFQREVEPPFEVFRDSWPKVVHTVGLDTGCCFGIALTALVTTDGFASWSYASVKAKRQYYKPSVPVHFALPRP